MDNTFNLISLCSGSGMLDRGLEQALASHGLRARTVAYSERESAAVACLRSRMEEQALEPAPIWGGNLEDFPAAQFHGLVDAIVAGFPCQPHSVAGARKGRDDERNLLPAILDIADTVGATALFLENVAGLKREFPYIVAQLFQRGWQLEWGTLRASEVGAAHRRERWFCLAYREYIASRPECRIEPWWWSLAQAADRAVPGAPGDRLLADSAGGNSGSPREDNGIRGAGALGNQIGSLQVLADSISPRLEGHGRNGDREHESGRLASMPDGPATTAGGQLGDSTRALFHGARITREGIRQSTDASLDMADSHNTGRERAGPAEPEGRLRHALAFGRGLPVFAPGPTDERWPAILSACPWLAPALPAGALLSLGDSLLRGSEMEAQPHFHQLAHGLGTALERTRTDMLRIAGNGVVPQQAAAAFIELINRIKT